MKKRKILVSLLTAVALIALMAVPAMAAEEVGKTATVTVTEVISITLIDRGDPGLNWDSLAPGTTKEPEAAQNVTGAITLTAGAENNADAGVFLKGTDFTNAGATESFTISNAFYYDSDVKGSASAMSATYGGSAWKTIAPGASLQIYHWLSIPANQAADTYTSTFTYKAGTSLTE